MANNGVTGSYANEMPITTAEPEYANDPAAGGFFASDFRRHEDLKNMLDSNKDGLKLEAMKRIIGMVAKGKDASELFPAVVKNVVSKNIEVKKLVYVYLVRYAEEQQDLALLSISTFQRALKDPNQLIRASALRVLSSIRVLMIVPIMMLSIKDAVSDMSPYVHKTAAHAIPKLYSLDPEQKEHLIEVIEKLLSDKTTLVVGSAVMAFEEVCPERIDLIHKNYRKLCNVVVDVEEWGQLVIIQMLTRYARTQFTDPNKHNSLEEVEDKSFYESDESDGKNQENRQKLYVMDPDHRMLLRNSKPLLQSRNAAVVMAVAQLYYYLSPRNEINIITKALIRLLHSHREIQSVVLTNIATLTVKHKGMFEPYMKSFFVRYSDPTHIKLLKLDILTNLASETNISIILREFQTYVSTSDMEFVAATIQAIGCCACSIKEVTDTCLNGLVSLLSNKMETVVGESVVVIKKLLQMQPSEHKDIIIHMTRLVDNITVPLAKASILWLLGEYSDRVPKIAPDVLRKVAKTFINEEDIVKLQTLNLAAKLYLTNSKQTKLVTQYVFNLAKYDQNYDIRDRARFLRQLIMPQGEKGTVLAKYAKKILLASKPAPILESRFKDHDQFQLGSLSHYINARASGYHELPHFPENAPDASVRNVEVVMPWQEVHTTKKKKQILKKKSFYSETETSSPDEEGSSSSSKSGADSSESEASSMSESESDSEELKLKDKVKANNKSSNSESSSEEDSSSGDVDESDSSGSEEKNEAKENNIPEETKNNLDLLLDLEDFSLTSSSGSIIQPTSATNILMPSTEKTSSFVQNPLFSPVNNPVFIPSKQHELLNWYSGKGLTVSYRFTRTSNIYSPKMISVELNFINNGSDEIKKLCVPDKKSGDMEIKGMPEIASLPVGHSVSTNIGIDYNESTQPANLEITTEKQKFNVTIKAPIGEILQPVIINEENFSIQQGKLKGMNENSCTIELPKEKTDGKHIVSKLYEVANIMQVLTTDETSGTYRFASKTLSSESLVLVSVQVLNNGKAYITVNCEKIMIGSMLLKELREALGK
ncbi:LOW QUALITY PROTEIN: AP-3 complex subunit beta-2-like [Tachypleus tridentatus]|uniref:LOW QUALITY PROTEIN: AP-3 complex subunit beta-2-like n=1 Tax=Tachypleus tridentatus TaxID=6853 RepID=UPI003FD380C8